VAHLLLLLAYQVLSTQKPFEDRMAPPLDERQKERMIRHHIRRLGKLGIAVRGYAPVTPAKGKCRPFAEVETPKRRKKRSAPKSLKT